MFDVTGEVKAIKAARRPRIGPAMQELADVVSACPGICMSAALRATGRESRGLGATLLFERTLSAGLIIADDCNPWVKRGTYALFANERARTLFNLRSELLRGNPSPERAEEIVAEVERLRAEQAATWVA